jgi:hypothetical protein
MTTAVSEKKHAVLGPSGWHTWGNCPGSVVLSDGIPKTTSRYAKEGTAAHQLLEDCLGDNTDAEDAIGREYEVEGEVLTVAQEMADAVNSAIDIVKSYCDEGALLQAEQTVPLAFMTGEEDAEGTCDVAVIAEKGTHLYICDFKYGKGVQVYASEKIEVVPDADGDPVELPPKPNGQLAMYGLGWLQRHGFLYEDVEKVTLVVIQPRIEWHDEFTLPIDQLRAVEEVGRDASGRVALTRQAHLEGAMLDLNPGEKQCKFCAAKAFCPALKDAVTQSLTTIAAPSDPAAFEDLSLPKKAASLKVDESATNEQLAEIMRAWPLIEDFGKAVRAEVERRLFAGQDVPGFYIGVGRKGNRAWKDDEAAIKELTKSGRLKMADALQRKPISPTTAEKAFKDRPKVWSKIAAHIHQPEGKPSVCKEGDSNPRYEVVSPPEAFANLDAPELITKVYGAATGNAVIVETDRNRVLTLDPSASIAKAAKVGHPVATLDALIAQQKRAEPSIEDIMG